MKYLRGSIAVIGIGFLCTLAAPVAEAAEQFPWGQAQPPRVITPTNIQPVASRQTNNDGYGNQPPYNHPPQNQSGSGNYYAPAPQSHPGQNGQYQGDQYRTDQYRTDQYRGNGQNAPQYGNGRTDNHGQPYRPAPHGYSQNPGPYAQGHSRGYSSEEIAEAGRNFFGTVSSGLASVIEYAFQKQGRPNGYILGEEAGGAFVAGLRYGEGVLHTRDAGRHKVYWQGPSIGYDFGAEGSKTMILVYNLGYPEQIYRRFSGVDGSAYLVGGVGITFQKRGDVVLAPIRSGVGVRLGANVGYLKYTRYPTWNPF